MQRFAQLTIAVFAIALIARCSAQQEAATDEAAIKKTVTAHWLGVADALAKESPMKVLNTAECFHFVRERTQNCWCLSKQGKSQDSANGSTHSRRLQTISWQYQLTKKKSGNHLTEQWQKTESHITGTLQTNDLNRMLNLSSRFGHRSIQIAAVVNCCSRWLCEATGQKRHSVCTLHESY